MKSFEELYNEMMENEALKAAFKKATEEGSIEAFLKEHDAEDSVEDFIKKFTDRIHEIKELSDDELDKVAGGLFTGWGTTILSFLQCLANPRCTW